MQELIAAIIGGTIGYFSRKKKRKAVAKKSAPSKPASSSKPSQKKAEPKKEAESSAPKKRVVKREPSKPAPKRRRTRKATGESSEAKKETPTRRRRKSTPSKPEASKKSAPKKSEPKKEAPKTTRKGKPTKYTAVRKAEKIVVMENGKEKIYEKGEFLNGLYEYAEGGKVSDTHKYIKRADVVKVILEDGKEVKGQANGYWVKK